MNHDRVTREGQEMAALYALGALSQQEARAFDQHLHEGCLACYAELEHFDQVVGVLGSATLPVHPPSYLRDILTVRIEKEAADSARAAESASGSSRAAESASGSVLPFPEKAGIHRTPDPAPSLLGRVLLPWAAAAALLIALAYTFTAWRSERQSLGAALDQEKARSSEILGDSNELKERLETESAKSIELAEINAVLGSPEWRIIPLAGQPPAPDSSAKVYWDVRGTRWVVSADLPPPPPGKVYQLWFVTSAAKISAGLIHQDKTGHGFATLQFPSNVTQLAAAAITLEPEGGSQQPTMPIYALGKVS